MGNRGIEPPGDDGAVFDPEKAGIAFPAVEGFSIKEGLKVRRFRRRWQ